MYFITIWNYFKKKENKPKYLCIAFSKAVERGTLFIFFCIYLLFLSWTYQETHLMIKELFYFMEFYVFFVIPLYGIFREISFDYKLDLQK